MQVTQLLPLCASLPSVAHPHAKPLDAVTVALLLSSFLLKDVLCASS